MRKRLARKMSAATLSIVLAFTTSIVPIKAESTSGEINTKQIKNIIYMIPDGAGFPAYNVAKEVKKAGGLKFAYTDSFTGTVPTSDKMYLDDYLVGACETKSANAEVTDSAAAGTALATGKKTNNNYIGVDSSSKPNASILELAQLENKMTGIVVTSNGYDATPGAFGAHASARNLDEDVITQLSNSDIDIIIGAGTNYKVSNGETIAKNGGYVTVANEQELREEIGSYTKGSGKKIWATMNKNEHHLPYDYKYGKKYDGIDDTGKNAATLAEMTELSIDMLDKSENGFFLMVEGSKVDYACHGGNLIDSTSEYIAFDEAFKVALDYAKGRTDTMIVVVPDHNTGLKVTPLKEKAGSTDARPTMSTVVEKIQSGSSTIVSDCSKLEWSASKPTHPHTEMNVPVFMYLPDGVSGIDKLSANKISESDTSKYVIANTEIAPYLASLISERTLSYATKELYAPVSKMNGVGSYKDGKFTFSDGTICKANSDVAKLQGKDNFDMGGEICLYQNDIFYAPKKLLDKIGIEYEIPVDGNLEGEGTKENPYIIATATDFTIFTNKLKDGTTYEDKYIKQNADIDMTQITGYLGIGSEAVFSGYYDGQGHTINVSITDDSENGTAIFPYTDGTIINLGTTGRIENTATDGGCAGIVRSIRENGKIINCWSTVTLNAKKDAGGITWTVKADGKAVNCYYKGKITCKNNYGIGIECSGSSVRNCYYQMLDGSTELANTTNTVGGKETTDFSADNLNKNIESVSEITRATDKLCRFEDADGRDFTFEGNNARLSKLCYKYTDKNGVEKEFEIKNFDDTVTGYQVQLGTEVKVGDEITVYGETCGDSSIYSVKQSTVSINEYGFATGSAIVLGKAQTTDYTTSSSKIYAINFSIEIETTTESTEKPTETQSTEKPTPTETESTEKPTPTETETESTEKPTPTETETQSTEKPTETQSTERPTETQSTEKPTQTPSNKIVINRIITNKKSTGICVGQKVTFNTTVESDTSKLKYQYEIRKGNRGETRFYSTNSQYTWVPKQAGKYSVTVRVKDDSGSIASKRITYTVLSTVKISRLSVSKITKKTKKITLSANVAGGSKKYLYRFAIRKNNMKKLQYLSKYKAAKSVKINKPKKGRYEIYVYVKDRVTGKVVTRTRKLMIAG